MSIPRDHHFIPAFYLRRWDNNDGKVVEYSRPTITRFAIKEVSAEATGFRRNLYSMSGVAASDAQILEQKFFSPLDFKASRSLAKMLDTGQQLTAQDKTSWAMFILSLAIRMPEEIGDHKDFVANDWRASLDTGNELSREHDKNPEATARWLDSLSATENERVALQCAINIVQSRENIDFLCRMQWHIARLNAPSHTLLASDRPLVLTNGIAYPDSYIVLPLSPNSYFLACNSEGTLRRFKEWNQIEKDINETVVSRAARYVWDRDRRQAIFVKQRLATRASPSLVATMRARLGIVKEARQSE